MLWIDSDKLQFHRGEICRVCWTYQPRQQSFTFSSARPQDNQLSYSSRTSRSSSSSAPASCTCSQGGQACSACQGSMPPPPSVKLYLSTGFMSWRVLGESLPLTGSFLWSIPSNCQQGSYQLQAKVKGSKTPSSSSSPSSSSITTSSTPSSSSSQVLSPVLNISIKDEMFIVSPVEGTEWVMGKFATIEWVCKGAQRDDIVVSIGSRFFRLATIAEKQPEQGSIQWKVPETGIRAGWYFLSIHAASSRVSAKSGWIYIKDQATMEEDLREEEEATAQTLEEDSDTAASAPPPPAFIMDSWLAPPAHLDRAPESAGGGEEKQGGNGSERRGVRC
ncbi:hypothetical protein GUITHDRAFT_155410 [Guillardia theta CCMP2712]|uniref:Uncharacterized protein n=3 Tax=Guillardia theta TaxID=55529 RepID=L1IHM1_GUITC|nr:hypothetical protein GUITHDRAFT_155410 [Guillardia theta CCMP2712]EKX35746.1 hypothetical protein GUITHDRAFT_155410 [Guillardia theta CCMP2712]|mmetsp:Transcript_37040/g.116538  ORF Transcript_37040/g.116538 Transcript_37040/m.116538 type:complete len:333 (+) Transcript_37040:1404-2402(+)|eukprot:XP_005822726.1 hypothetical protein GUITHDRAFT_155410 [Guillardia theta CCMP2712]